MINYYDDFYLEYEIFKYFKVGEQNVFVDIYIYDVWQVKFFLVVLGMEKDIYIFCIKWIKDLDELCVYWMNCYQN